MADAPGGVAVSDPIDLRLGDCLDVLKTLPDNSVDSVVTDPPYGLSFMGKRWDYDVPSVEVWAECLRVLKPGGHLLAFAGTRTQHRMAVRIEDAGFEIRDMIAWVYSTGFPKSLNVSKAIDKAAGAEREVVGPSRANIREDLKYGGNDPSHNHGRLGAVTHPPITAPATDAARQWSGWGTALKPALEPITVARKPLAGTVAACVTTWGTGAINVDGCRVGHAEECRMMAPSQANIDNPSEKHRQAGRREAVLELKPAGRWPANLIHDGSDEVVGLFPAEAERVEFIARNGQTMTREEQGSAARFFYAAKASKADRDEGCESLPRRSAGEMTDREEDTDGLQSPRAGAGRTGGARNFHPTVKPTDLMRYLCRLVTPPGGVVLDPFMGSGSTGKAAIREGFRFIGIERDPDYMTIARARIVRGVQPSML
jgi:hypothetical protein